jgi:hypothetical protein
VRHHAQHHVGRRQFGNVAASARHQRLNLDAARGERYDAPCNAAHIEIAKRVLRTAWCLGHGVGGARYADIMGGHW